MDPKPLQKKKPPAIAPRPISTLIPIANGGRAVGLDELAADYLARTRIIGRLTAQLDAARADRLLVSRIIVGHLFTAKRKRLDAHGYRFLVRDGVLVIAAHSRSRQKAGPR